MPEGRPRFVGWLGVILSFLAVLVFVVPRDLSMEKQYTGDLRNRVVGARLIHDGRSPYFYKWKTGDGVRYYDPANFDSLRSSNSTATPFFHHLLIPLAEWPESRASIGWLIAEYLFFGGILALALSMAATIPRRWTILLTAALFLLTAGWKAHIALGQSYICIPFFAMLFLWFLIRGAERHIAGRLRPADLNHPASLFYPAAAGLAAAFLVLIKPNAILFLLPFLFLTRAFSRRQLWACCAVPAILLTWILISPQERALWVDYREGVTEQIKMHQHLHPALQQNEPDPHLAVFEGIDQRAVAELEARQPLSLFSENGNVFVLVEKLFHRRLSLTMMSVAAGTLILLLTGLYFLRLRHSPPGPSTPGPPASTLQHAAIMGFCLYMVSDLFSPVYRHQYYTVQWICPLLIAAALFEPALRRYYILLLAGLLLNIFHADFIKMGHTLGEYLLLVTLLAFVLLPDRRSPVLHNFS
ncbi:MAG: glycosyltransferase 87 family protein [Bacteroidota bacterium]|nr:glycosyltransferase 87 family protein [Bacteroidota bacterium]